MKLIIRLVVFLLVVGIISAVVLLVLVNQPVSNSQSDVDFTIVSGQGVKQIGKNLAEQDLIRSKLVFEIYVWAKEVATKFLAGTFTIPAGSSVKEVVSLLTSNKPANEITLQFIEGWSTRNISDYLISEKIIATSDEFNEWNEAGKWQEEFSFLAVLPANTSLEGYFFPDTYNFFSDAKVEDVIFKMLANFNIKLTTQMRSDIATAGRTIHEVIILASILEEEVKTQADMRLVADIFLKRLNLGMALQADSTLNYVTGGTNTSLTAEELKIDSAYNTYRYRGLPPTPISNPGFNAIKAAIYPESNEYYFFLTSPDGQVYYGRTLDEHNSNRQYLK